MRKRPCLATPSPTGVSLAGANGSGGTAAPAKPASGDDGAPPTLVSEASLGPLLIRKWRLSNGLEVILLPDAAARGVAYMTWFRVGSRHENAAAGETGLAHLFEHLMFTQTASARAAGEFDLRMEQAGANTNAMTYYDFTAYIDEVPPEAIAVAVELEADRMTNLALTDEQVSTEREVVAEERLGSVEDSVDGTLDEMMYGRAFVNHPYRHPVIGHMVDIRAVTREKATRFYRKFYAPNNAVVVVTGRFDAAAVLTQVAARYRSIAPSPDLPIDQIRPERAPTSILREEIERPVAADRLVVGFPSPALGADDRAAFEVLDEILTGGPSARLHRRLVVDAQIASSVDASPAPTRDPGLYGIWIQMRTGHRAEEAEALLDEEIATCLREPPPAGDLTKAKNRIETAFWRGLTSSEGRANQLGEFDVVAGDYRRLLERAEEIERVTAADVQKAAQSYLGGPGRVVLVARPKGSSQAAGAETPTKSRRPSS